MKNFMLLNIYELILKIKRPRRIPQGSTKFVIFTGKHYTQIPELYNQIATNYETKCVPKLVTYLSDDSKEDQFITKKITNIGYMYLLLTNQLSIYYREVANVNGKRKIIFHGIPKINEHYDAINISILKPIDICLLQVRYLRNICVIHVELNESTKIKLFEKRNKYGDMSKFHHRKVQDEITCSNYAIKTMKNVTLLEDNTLLENKRIINTIMKNIKKK